MENRMTTSWITKSTTLCAKRGDYNGTGRGRRQAVSSFSPRPPFPASPRQTLIGQVSLGQIRQMEATADRSHVLHRLFPPRLVFRPSGKLSAELPEIGIGDPGAVGAERL